MDIITYTFLIDHLIKRYVIGSVLICAAFLTYIYVNPKWQLTFSTINIITYVVTLVGISILITTGIIQKRAKKHGKYAMSLMEQASTGQID